MPTIFETYNVDSNTSMVLLNTTNLPNNNDIVVLLSNTNLPGRIISVRDTTGNLSTTKRVVVSTIGGVTFLDGASSVTLNQPFAFVTVANRDPSTWVLTNTFAFPAEKSAASVESVSAKYIIASTIQAQNVFSTTSMTISSLNVENVVTTNDLAGRGNLYLNVSSVSFPSRGNAAIRGVLWAGSTISTGADLFVGSNISTLKSIAVGANAFISGNLTVLNSSILQGPLHVNGNTTVSSLSSIGRIGLGSHVLMSQWNLQASSINTFGITASNSITTTSFVTSNATTSNLTVLGPTITMGADVLVPSNQVRAASTLATNVVASNVMRAESTVTSTLLVYSQTNMSSLSTTGDVAIGGDLFLQRSRLFGLDFTGSTLTMSNTITATSTVTSNLFVMNSMVVSTSISTLAGTVGFGNNVVMGGYTLTAGNVNTSTLTASNAITTSTLNANSTFGLSLTLASTTNLTGRTISTIRYEGGQAAISSIAGDGSLLFNLAAVSSLSLQSTIVGLGQIYTSAAGAGVNQTQLVSTNIGLGTFGYISSAAAISGSFITPGNMETGLSTQQLYVSDITLSNAITATYTSGTPPNPVALFDAVGGGSVYMKMRSGAANELFYGVDGTGNAVIYSQWPGLQLQPLNMYGSLITANTAEFQVTAGGPNTNPLTQIKNTYVSSYQLYASSATFTKVIADGSLLSNLPLSTVATFTSNTASGVSSLHGVVSSGLSTVALFTSNTSNFFQPLTATNISSGFSTLALFTSNTALGVSSLHGVVSSGLSTVALFTSNTALGVSSLFGVVSTGQSTIALFTSNTARGVSSLHGVVSSGLSTVALFTSNTALGVSSLHGVVSSGLSTVSLFTSNTALGVSSLHGVVSSGLSTVALFTSNTALGVSSLHGVVSSGLSTVALFTSNTALGISSLHGIVSTGLSTVATGAGGYVSTLSSAIGTQTITSNLIASTIRSIQIQPAASNQWVAVGSNSGGGGTNILYSLNGVSWVGGTTNNFSACGNAVAYGNGLWVAVGRDSTANNTIKYSVDGITWSNITGGGGGFSTEGFDVKWNGRIWVAVGNDSTQNNTIKYSLNGITWSNSSGNGFAGGQGTGVAWNGRMWVAGGIGTTTQNWLKYSFDGITWSNANSIQDGGNLSAAGFQGRWDGKQWVWAAAATGGTTHTDHFKWSTDGSNWFSGGATSIGTNYWNVNYNGFIYVYPGWGTTQNNCVAYSTAPLSNLSFVNTNFTASIALYQGALWNGYYWVMGGRVSLTTQSNATLEISADGITWTNTTGVGFTSEARGLAYTSNLPVYRQTNLDILEQNIPMSITSTNQFLFAQSSMVINNTLRVDALGRVGINSNIPQYSLDVNGTVFLSTTQTTLVSTRQVLLSSLGVNCNAPQYPFDANGIVKTNGYFLGDSTDNLIANGIHELLLADGQNFGQRISTGIYFSKGTNNNFSGLNFLTTSNLTTVSSLTMAAASGFVGIMNCNSPQSALDVNGQVGAKEFNLRTGNTGTFYISTNYNSYPLVNILGGNSRGFVYAAYNTGRALGQGGDGVNFSYNYYNNDAGSDVIPNGAGQTSVIRVGYGQILFGTSTVGAQPQFRAMFDQNGNFGINCNAPTNRLDVNGTAFLSTTQTTLLSTQRIFTSSIGVNCNAPAFTLDVNGRAQFSTALTSVGSTLSLYASSMSFVNITPAAPNLWVAIGYDSTASRSIRYSTDGIAWTLANNSFTSLGNGVAWNGYMWVAVGQDSTQNNTIKYSYDGINWSNSAGTGFTSRGFTVAWNGRMWVAVGQDSTQNNTIKYSLDGITWSNSAGTGFTSYGYGVGWNGRMWVAGGADSTAANTIKYSYNGINWSNSATGGFTTEGHVPVWNGRMWVIGGSDSTAANRIKYSYDGINWSNSVGGDTFSQSAGGYAPAWNGDLWLIGGYNNTLSNGVIKWSRDGITWSNVTSLAVSDGCLNIAWNGRQWVAACDSIPNGTSGLVYSTDGLNWTAGTGQFSFHAYGVGYSSNVVPSYSQANLDILPQNIDYTLRSTNAIFLAPSSLVLNDTLRVDVQWLRVGVNSNTPQYDLDVNGRMRSRIIISNVTGTSLTSATSPPISAATFGIYYNLTNSGFNALTVPTLSTGDAGSFWLLRNNTTSALSITVTGAVSGIPPSPLSISASNSAIVSWDGSAFVMF